MNIAKEKIKELRELYKIEFGKEITFEQASELGSALISIYFIFYDP